MSLGLLEPAERTRSGHRLYGPGEVRRLQQVVSLRQAGLSLERIGELLDREGLSAAEVLDLHLDRLREELRRTSRLIEVLEGLRGRMADQAQPPLEEVTRALAETLRHERYFTPEQLEGLARRRGRVGESRMEEAGAAWAEILEGFTRSMEEGADPSSPAVVELARRARALVEEFTGGDPALRASLGRMYAEEGGASILSLRGMETAPGLWEYMGRAGAALDDEGGGGSGAPSP